MDSFNDNKRDDVTKETVVIDDSVKNNTIPDVGEEKKVKETILYSIDETPPLPLCLLLGFQHYLTSFGSTFAVPMVLAGPLCIAGDVVGLSKIISTIFFMSGIATILQTTIGNRLPIVQGATFAFLVPTIAILSSPEFTCPDSSLVFSEGLNNESMRENSSCVELTNNTCLDREEVWQRRMREIQGAICVSAIFQVVIGMTGLISVLLRYIGPLSISPTITLVGLSLFEVAADKSASHWWIAITTIIMIVIFSQYLSIVNTPLLYYSSETGWNVKWLPLFKLFPILFAMLLAWLLCYILTTSGALSDNRQDWGYNARTDIRSDVLRDTAWIRIPYPGQWGVPTVSVSAVFGMLAGVLASMIESVGDYYACARLAGAPPPPPSAVNRGIATEGFCCILAGLMGTGNGTTSYSENVGAIGITKVGSRRVIQTAGVLLVILGCFGKIGAVFVTIPDPVVGGMFMVMFGMITAVGLSNLQFVNLRSSRNIFIIGVSFFFGLSFPHWVNRNENSLNVGNSVLSQIIRVLLGTSMFVGGLIGFILDSTLPGTLEERGILLWRGMASDDDSSDDKNQKYKKLKTYDIPFIQRFLNRVSLFRFCPVCPNSDKLTEQSPPNIRTDNSKPNGKSLDKTTSTFL